MRYLRLLGIQLRTSLVLSMQYRADFLLDGFIEIFWMATAIIPLLVVFHLRPVIAGWSLGEALMVMGWFTFLQGVLEGAVNPSLTTDATTLWTSGFSSRPLVWLSNCGEGSLTLIIAVRPSSVSRPEKLASFSLRKPCLRA